MTTNPTNLTDARTRESEKTPEQRAEDIAYTLNHPISCGLTDVFVQPFASAAVVTAAQNEKLSRGLRWLTKIFEHDHGPKNVSFWRKLWENTKHWFMGEIVGDAGGILPTVLTQRFFPGFMDGMRNILEPIAGGAFRAGAHRDAVHWATKRGFAEDSPEAKQKEASLYEHEISHLPQAVMWNVYSIPINFLTQRYIFPHKHDGHVHRIKWKEFIVGKIFGSVISNGVLLGGRAIAPEKFNEMDRWNSENILAPVLQGPGQLLGIDKKTADKVVSEKSGTDWQARLHSETAAAEAASETAQRA